jgi:2-haloacid dehalogenase
MLRESLLDLQVLRPLFQRICGDGATVDAWFGETILYSESATLTSTFAPLGQLGAGAAWPHPSGEADVTELSQGLASLPPHSDVPDSLRKLKASGYRLVTLTDSPTTPGRGPLQAAGLADLFEQPPLRGCAGTSPPARPMRWSPGRRERGCLNCA